jgi:NADPH:quinone reductase-like Zn-dependent oxidoreductase
MPYQNTALWLPKRGARFEVSSAPYTPPGADQVVVRARALAVNPVDGLPGFAYRVVMPWLTFPAIVGSDVAGEVVEVGPGVTRLRPGDRVVGHALGVEKSQNSPAEGAFQHYVVLMQHMVCAIPESLSFEQASVLPLALSTAASGMFQKDQLRLMLPGASSVGRAETVLVWGGSTSVGSNAIQLARSAGYRVVATASPHNFGYVRSLGAAEAVDYHSPTAVDEIVDRIGDSPLAGTLAITSGSLPPAVKIASRVAGSKRVASARPGPLTQLRARRARRLGVQVSIVWGSTLKDNEIGPAIYTDFLPAALTAGTYRAAPDASVVGDGLACIPVALQQLRDGVSATKLVVTV